MLEKVLPEQVGVSPDTYTLKCPGGTGWVIRLFYDFNRISVIMVKSAEDFFDKYEGRACGVAEKQIIK